MQARRASGYALIVASIASTLALGRHPHATTHGAAEVIAEIARKGAIDRAFHGAMLALLGAQLLGYLALCAHERRSPLAIRVGLVAACTAFGLLVLAATFDGFVLPAIAERQVASGSTELTPMILCVTIVVQAARLATIAQSIAFVAWSLPLLARRARWVRVLGALAALGPGIATASGAVTPDVHGIMILAATQLGWNIGLGAHLVRTPAAAGATAAA